MENLDGGIQNICMRVKFQRTQNVKLELSGFPAEACLRLIISVQLLQSHIHFQWHPALAYPWPDIPSENQANGPIIIQRNVPLGSIFRLSLVFIHYDT